MGLHIHNLGGIPVESDRNYYVYILDYGWKEPLTETLIQNFTNMARMAADSKSVVIAGIDPIHFANQVFSWHGINGENGEKVLPAIMITSLHPHYFHNHNDERGIEQEMDDKLLIIPLKKVCKTTDDVIEMIKSVFSDIAEEKSIISFNIAKEMKKSERGRFTDALILEPNFSGLGIKLPQLFKWITGKG